MTTITTFAIASALYLGSETLCTRETYRAIQSCARGCYQRALLADDACWSGADLRGKARDYSDHYATSRANLIKRIKKTHMVTRLRGEHGRVVLLVESTEEAERREALQSGAVVVPLAPLVHIAA